MSSEKNYEFKADTQKVLRIIINSLYQHKEVFLRELLSNSSDALNKVRIKQLTSEDIEDPNLDLKITILLDKEKKVLSVSDTGIGMTREELLTNLGTIAQSGTAEFLQAIETENNNDLIGQFGVGFYSAFLVAKKVEVITKSSNPGSKAYRWESTGEDSFSIEETEKDARGTDILLYLNEEEDENETYLEDYKLKSLVKQYSNYIEFPILLGEDTLNEQTALWRISPDEVTEEDYEKFFNHLGQFGKYMAKIHVRVDSPYQFYALLYIPPTKGKAFMTQESEWGIRMYNRKVLIEEKNKDVIPEYLRFVVGTVDAEDLDLNVSREVIQNSRIQRQMKNYLQKKILSTLEKIAQDDEDKYLEFYKEFGPFLKEGIASNDKFKDRLIDLLRFSSTAEDGSSGSLPLSTYVDRMNPDQEHIYYLSGLDLETLKKSPHLEYYKKQDSEVLLLGEAIDSFLMMHLTEYKDKKFFLIDQDETVDLEVEKEPEAEVEGEEKTEEKKPREGPYGKLLDKIDEVLKGKVRDVKTSDRLVTSVARLVTPKGGMSSDLQRAMRIMESQSGTGVNLPMMGKVLQVNPDHEMIKKMKALVEENPDDQLLEMLILQIHDNARLADGDVPDFTTMTSRVEKIMELSLK